MININNKNNSKQNSTNNQKQKQTQQSMNKKNVKLYPITLQNKTIDYRNCKYQGHVQVIDGVSQGLPAGYGIVLDLNYLWVAGKWQNGRLVDGEPMLAMLGDVGKLYGWFTGNQAYTNISTPKPPTNTNTNTNTISVYQANCYKLYIQGSTIILDMNSTNKYSYTLTKFQLPPKDNQQPLNIVHHQQYTSQQRRVQLLAQLLSISEVQVNQLQLEQFLKRNFRDLLSVYSCSVGTPVGKDGHNSKNSSQFTICHKTIQNSITLKLSRKLSNRITKLNYENGYQQIQKKYQYYSDGSGYIAQQSINGDIQCYVQYQCPTYKLTQRIPPNTPQLFMHRPTDLYQQCRKNLEQHYKRSLNFCNSFVNLSYIYNKIQYMQNMAIQCIKIIQIQQIQAHVNHISFHNYISSKLNKTTPQDNNIQENQFDVYQASIDDIRREIAKTQQIGRTKSRVRLRDNSRITEQYHRNVNQSMFRMVDLGSSRMTPSHKNYQYMFIQPQQSPKNKPTIHHTNQQNRTTKPAQYSQQFIQKNNKKQRILTPNNIQAGAQQLDLQLSRHSYKYSNINDNRYHQQPKFTQNQQKQNAIFRYSPSSSRRSKKSPHSSPNLSPSHKHQQYIQQESQQGYPYRYQPINTAKSIQVNKFMHSSNQQDSFGMKSGSDYQKTGKAPLSTLMVDYEDIEEQIYQYQRQKSAKRKTQKTVPEYQTKLSNKSKTTNSNHQSKNQSNKSKYQTPKQTHKTKSKSKSNNKNTSKSPNKTKTPKLAKPTSVQAQLTQQNNKLSKIALFYQNMEKRNRSTAYIK